MYILFFLRIEKIYSDRDVTVRIGSKEEGGDKSVKGRDVWPTIAFKITLKAYSTIHGSTSAFCSVSKWWFTVVERLASRWIRSRGQRDGRDREIGREREREREGETLVSGIMVILKAREKERTPLERLPA